MPIRTSSSFLAVSTLAAAAALAQDDAAPPLTVEANVAFTSDYRFRGVSFSDGDFAVQGGFDLGHDSGLYIGTWASSIEEYGASLLIDASGFPVFQSGAETELDLYAGYGFEAGAAGFDAGVIGYFYPGSEDTHYYELYGAVAGEAGPADLASGVAWVPEQDNAGGDNLYLYADAGFTLGGTGLGIDLHLGYTDGAFVFSGDDQFDWAAGVSTEALGLVLSAAYVGTDADTNFGDLGLPPAEADDLEDAAEDIYGDTIVLTVSRSF